MLPCMPSTKSDPLLHPKPHAQRTTHAQHTIWHLIETEHTSGNTINKFRSDDTTEAPGGQVLSVDETEPDYGTIRNPPIIGQLTPCQDRISQRHGIPSGGSRPSVPQVWSTGAVLAIRREVRELWSVRSALEYSSLTSRSSNFSKTVSLM